MAAIRTTEVWVRLDENVEDLLLNGVPKLGDTVTLTYPFSSPNEEDILATRDLGKASNAEYLVVETNNLNNIMGS